MVIRSHNLDILYIIHNLRSLKRRMLTVVSNELLTIVNCHQVFLGTSKTQTVSRPIERDHTICAPIWLGC